MLLKMSKSKLLKSVKTSPYDASKIRTVGGSKGVKMKSIKQSAYTPALKKER